MLEELAGSSPVTVQVPYNQLYQQPLAMSGNVFTIKVPFSWQGFQAPTALPTVVGAITMTRVNSTGQAVQNANLSTSGALSFTLGNDGVSGHANVPVILDTSQFAAGDVILIYVTVSQAFELPSGVTTGSISPSCQMLALNVANQSYNLVAQATSDGTVTAAAVTLKWWNFPGSQNVATPVTPVITPATGLRSGKTASPMNITVPITVTNVGTPTPSNLSVGFILTMTFTGIMK